MDTTILVITHRSPVLDDDQIGSAGRIIVPLDGSELSLSALEPASRLARRLGARVELVTTRVPEAPPAPVLTTFLDDIADAMDDVETTTVARPERDPAVAIEAMLADGDEPTMIVMSSRGRSRVGRAVLGSVAEAVVAIAEVPVLVVGPAFDSSTFTLDGSVLLAHDNVHTPDMADIARIARVCGGYVGVIEVFRTIEPTPLEGCSPRVEACAAELRELGLMVQCESWPGQDPAETIVEQASLQRSSVIALTTRNEQGVSRFAGGSVAADIVRISPVPVLVMRARPADDIVQV